MTSPSINFYFSDPMDSLLPAGFNNPSTIWEGVLDVGQGLARKRDYSCRNPSNDPA